MRRTGLFLGGVILGVVVTLAVAGTAQAAAAAGVLRFDGVSPGLVDWLVVGALLAVPLAPLAASRLLVSEASPVDRGMRSLARRRPR